MWHVPIELHEASLRLMRRIMHFILLLPPRPLRYLKFLYMIVLFVYLGFIVNWRISFNYHVVYDIKLDQFSRIIDVLNYLALITCHIVVAMELLWKNRGEEIEQQLEKIRFLLRVQFGYKVNLLTIRRYCQGIYGSLFLRCLLLMGMTIYNNMVTDVSLLLYYNFYSEMVLLTRISEFSLYSALILAFYQELHEVSLNLFLELERTRSEIWSVQRVSLERLSTLWQLHGLLWNTIRSIECNFELSVITVTLKLFVDIFVLPYWIFINLLNQTNTSVVHYCIAEELCKFLEVLVPCLIWNRCELVQRQIRSIFHSLNTDRSDVQLNSYLLRISTHLGQESCQFSAGGFLVINNETLGKFIFGMASYIVICIQFRMTLLAKSPTDAVETVTVTVATDA
ncbi:putative gustatory receptor 98a [Drosophila innubila]|uniref:putative gustatory receptor 98a n=1 Tax=Drosophila innubila TaxID=198719 RepID=UPI00148BFCD3|nr:putative gustatory receptor 98a [Drosophila innubila]